MITATRVALALALGAALAQPAASAAGTPAVADLVSRMKAVLEPAQPSLRKLTIRTSSPWKGEYQQFVAGQARKRGAAGARVVTVLLAPADQRGTGWLVQESPQETLQWLWVPYVSRVRKLYPLPGYEAFLESDFTYADLGLVDMHAKYTLLGEETLGDKTVYRVQAVPAEQWYYSRIVSWMDAASGFPLKREFYASGGDLWKVETFDQVTEIQGVPTVLRRRMDNIQEKTTTEITVSSVRYGADIPDSLFEVGQLPTTSSAPIWSSVGLD